MVLLFVIIFSNNELKALQAAHVRTSYTYWTDIKYIYPEPCRDPGNQCIVVVAGPFTLPGSIAPVGGGQPGRIITFTFNDESETHTPNSGLGVDPYVFSRSKSNRTFMAGESVRITDCTEDETLVGLTFDLEGKTTDGNGNLSFYIPY